MSERRAGTKGRRLGSSRRKQLHEGSREAPAPAPSPAEEPPWASEILQRVQLLLSDRDTEQAAVIARSDMQVRVGLTPEVQHCWGTGDGEMGGFLPWFALVLEIAGGRFAVQQGGAGARV